MKPSTFLTALLVLAIAGMVGMAGADSYPQAIYPATPLATDTGQANTLAFMAHQLIGTHEDATYLLGAGQATSASGFVNYTIADFRHRAPPYPDYLLFTANKSTTGEVIIIGFGMNNSELGEALDFSGDTYKQTINIFKNVTEIYFYEFTAGTTFEVGLAKSGPMAVDDDWLMEAGTTTNPTGWDNYTAESEIIFFAAHHNPHLGLIAHPAPYIIHQPDYARCVLLTPNQSTSGTAYINGTDIAGSNIVEELLWNASPSAKTTDRAFKTVSEISFLDFTAGTTFKVGVDKYLGLNTKLAMNTMTGVFLDGSLKSLGIFTTTTDPDELSYNTGSIGNTTLAYTKPVDLYYMVN